MRIPMSLRRIAVLLLLVTLLAACGGATQPETSQEPAGEEAASTENEQTATEAEGEQPEEAESEVPAESESSTSDPLIVLIDNDEGPITPPNFNTFIGFWMIGWVYDPLFARSPDLDVVPALATGVERSDDGLTWNITLRDDVTWHDGEPFTAEDVIFSYNFLRDAGRAPNLEAIESMEADGDHALTLTLSEPAPFFLNEGLAGYYIMPEHIWRDQEPVSGELSQFQGKIGTGPYFLEEVVPGESYTFRANPDYFRGAPTVGSIIAKIVKDRTQQFSQLRTGEAHAVLSSVPPAQVAQLESDEGIAISKGSDFFNYIFYLNGSKPPLDRTEVRQAIAMAIDAQTLVDVVMVGEGTVLPLSWYHPELPWSINVPNEFDPDAANRMLDEAGLEDTDGDGTREFDGEAMVYEILCDTNNNVEVRATELIAGWLGDVGIPATQRCMDIDTAVTLIWPNFVAVPDPDYDMGIWGWSSGPQFQRGFIRGMIDSDFGGAGWANLTGMTFPNLETLVDEYVTASDPARIETLNEEIQQEFATALPWVPLMSPAGNFAYRPEVYDGWVYVRGTGIMTVWSFLPPEALPGEIVEP